MRIDNRLIGILQNHWIFWAGTCSYNFHIAVGKLKRESRQCSSGTAPNPLDIRDSHSGDVPMQAWGRLETWECMWDTNWPKFSQFSHCTCPVYSSLSCSFCASSTVRSTEGFIAVSKTKDSFLTLGNQGEKGHMQNFDVCCFSCPTMLGCASKSFMLDINLKWSRGKSTFSLYAGRQL